LVQWCREHLHHSRGENGLHYPDCDIRVPRRLLVAEVRFGHRKRDRGRFAEHHAADDDGSEPASAIDRFRMFRLAAGIHQDPGIGCEQYDYGGTHVSILVRFTAAPSLTAEKYDATQ